MKSLPTILCLIAFTVFAFYVAFKFNIPVDNQIAMAFIGVVCFFLTLTVIVYDIKEYIKERKNKPQTF